MNVLRITMLITALTGVVQACGSNDTAAIPADIVLANARVFTSNAAAPWAEAVAIDEGRIVFVGTSADAQAYVDGQTMRHDLQQQLVIPGIVDAHTHPGLVSILGDGALGTEPDTGNAGAPFPQTSLEDMQAWLRDYAANNDDFIISVGEWPSDMFGIEGPRKEWIDEAAPGRLVVIFDTSGHSQWVSSPVLTLLGIDKDAPDPAPGLSFFVRDPDGEPTGWVKEFALVQSAGVLLLPEAEQLKNNLREVVHWLAARGVTSLVDAGNLEFNDDVYGSMAELEAAGELPLRYEGSYHIFLPGQQNNAIAEVNRLRAAYGGDRLTFNTIKIHFDGVLEIRTASVLEPYADDPTNFGRTLLTAEQVTQLLLDMEGENMHLHTHCVGDAATRTVLDAVEAARETLGTELSSRVTISHIELLEESDIQRFVELGVVANYAPHWHGEFGDGVSTETAGPLGSERNTRKHRAKLLQDNGVIVNYSSDVTASMRRASPFLGIQIGHTRQDTMLDALTPPADQRLTLEQTVVGYTLNGAYQQGWEDRLGSIEVGKVADIVVLDRDIFDVDPFEIGDTLPTAVLLEGEVTQGSLE